MKISYIQGWGSPEKPLAHWNPGPPTRSPPRASSAHTPQFQPAQVRHSSLNRCFQFMLMCVLGQEEQKQFRKHVEKEQPTLQPGSCWWVHTALHQWDTLSATLTRAARDVWDLTGVSKWNTPWGALLFVPCPRQDHTVVYRCWFCQNAVFQDETDAGRHHSQSELLGAALFCKVQEYRILTDTRCSRWSQPAHCKPSRPEHTGFTRSLTNTHPLEREPGHRLLTHLNPCTWRSQALHFLDRNV